jgi:lysophospholipase L1-like esterase
MRIAVIVFGGRRVAAAGLALAALAFALAGADAAAAQTPLSVTAEATTRGTVDVAVQLVEAGQAPFATVTTDAAGRARARLTARCDHRRRTVVAVAGALQAQAAVTTPSCADRFTLALSPRTAARKGKALRVQVGDHWRAGKTPARVCLWVRSTPACRQTQLPARVSLRARRAGRGELRVSGAGFRFSAKLDVLGPRAPIKLLATGDSMIQIIDGDLKAGLGARASVRSDARISTGISKPFMFDWVAHAGKQAASIHPQATVMFIGANDGFTLGGATCCGDAWVQAYAQRVKAMMESYRRGGAGRVYWLTIPTPRDPQRKAIYDQVNKALRRAAAAFPRDEVSLIDLVAIFTPGGHFRAAINGQTVRQEDGIHLNPAGAAIAARAIERRLHADGLI